MRTIIFTLLLTIIFTSCKHFHTTTTTITRKDSTVVTYKDTTLTVPKIQFSGNLNIDSLFKEWKKGNTTVINKIITIKDPNGKGEIREYLDSLGILHQTVDCKEQKIDFLQKTLERYISEKELIQPVEKKETIWDKLRDYNSYILILIIVLFFIFNKFIK